MDGCEISALLIFGRIALFQQFKRFSQLEHGGKLMLTGIGAETVADQIADLTGMEVKLHFIRMAAFHNGVSFSPIQAEVPNLVVSIIVMAALGNLRADLHAFEVAEKEACAIAAADRC